MRWDQFDWLLEARRQKRGLGQVMAAFRLLMDRQLHVGALKGPQRLLHDAFLPIIRRLETARQGRGACWLNARCVSECGLDAGLGCAMGRRVLRRPRAVGEVALAREYGEAVGRVHGFVPQGRRTRAHQVLAEAEHVAGDGVMGCENVDGVGIEDGRVLLGSLTLRVRKRLTVVLTAASIG